MAGVGPPPKDRRARDRDNPVREIVQSDGKLGGWPLPDDVLPLVPASRAEFPGQREEWHPMTVAWWDDWRRSPQSTRMMTGPDWRELLDTALLHHQMWMTGGKNSERAGEIRMRVARWGATYADRLRLKWEVDVPDESDVGLGGNVTSMDSERRKRISGG